MTFLTFCNYVTVILQVIESPIYQDTYLYKPSCIGSKKLLVSKNMNSLVFTQKYFNCFQGNVGNMDVTRKRPHRQRANMCPFVSYIV